ncbi:WGR domain-containing protein [Flavobacterium foetidum]|uniref:WGR domain-containing protein n=1 Tax=Flavobacterium foetidum TaxID=2026681 RepID=UPI001074FAC3|nr:WGR domain-containing protein [Flavobacterium foetidum]KAF2509126.1 WGR domain-containing protein [Flavobacterium foetidum]
MEAYRYNDGKSDKFWRIEHDESAFAVNYGKTGTTGKYQIKEFESAADCQKEATKLIDSKKKKGYKLYPEFDCNNHYYFDDEEIGLHPLTSHPKFRTHFTEAFYYSCFDEETPFGSDEGSDTLAQIVEDLRKSKTFDFATFPKKMIEEYWDMTYLPAEDISHENIQELLKTDEMNLTQCDMVTYATAFAQIKITGKIDSRLKELAVNAMKRMEIIAEILKWNTSGKPSEIGTKMISELEQFQEK